MQTNLVKVHWIAVEPNLRRKMQSKFETYRGEFMHKCGWKKIRRERIEIRLVHKCGRRKIRR